ncbi:MAG TPA: hydrogenase maturation nickel metallochaperone HypA [Tepidisphaeraceae bacterium]|nr:hydrogenase maturation nickel metallochaperone HypA [Tepidisphaeraceae bacterium]
MHELSVAQQLVQLVIESLDGEGDVRVTAVRLRLGPLAGVEAGALRFAFDSATAGTMLCGARLVVEPVELVAFCASCGEERLLASVQRLRCPACDAPTPEIVRGRDLEVISVEVVDATADRAGAPAGAEEE